MKKMTVLLFMFIIIIGLTACVNGNADASDISDGNDMTIKLELDKDYDDTDPFVNEKLFCVTENLDSLIAEGTLNLVGESIVLEVKNNKTNEVLWSKTWEEDVKSEPVSIRLENLKTDDEYVVCLTGIKIDYAVLEITFDSNFVQERAMPL